MSTIRNASASASVRNSLAWANVMPSGPTCSAPARRIVLASSIVASVSSETRSAATRLRHILRLPHNEVAQDLPTVRQGFTHSPNAINRLANCLRRARCTSIEKWRANSNGARLPAFSKRWTRTTTDFSNIPISRHWPPAGPRLRGLEPGSAEYESLAGIMLGWWAALRAASDVNRDDKVSLDEVLLVVDQLPTMLDSVEATANAMFEATDENQDGRISAEEYHQLIEAWNGVETDTDAVFPLLDLNHDGHVSRTEFTAAVDAVLGRRRPGRTGHLGVRPIPPACLNGPFSRRIRRWPVARWRTPCSLRAHPRRSRCAAGPRGSPRLSTRCATRP